MTHTLPNWVKRPNRTLQSGDFIVFDGCDWVIETSIAGSPGFSCADVQNCVDCGHIMSQLSSTPSINKSGCGFSVNMNYILNNFTSDWTYPNLTIGNSVYNLSDILDHFSFELYNSSGLINITNGGSARILGIDGMRVLFAGTDISIGLPTTNRGDGLVLGWNGVTNSAEWIAPCDACCSHIQDCMEPIIDGLQNQINNITNIVTTGGSPEQYTSGGVVDVATQTINFSYILGGGYDVDLSPLFTSLGDNFVNDMTFGGTTLTLDMVSGATYTVDLAPLLDNTDAQTLSRNPASFDLSISNGNTVNLSALAQDEYVIAGSVVGNDIVLTRNIGADVIIAGAAPTELFVNGFSNPSGTVLRVSRNDGNVFDLDIAPLIGSVASDTFTVSAVLDPVTSIATFTRNDATTYDLDLSSFSSNDELVKVTANDTTESYLRNAIGNANTTDTTNDGTIKVRVNNPSADETIQYVVDLTIYNGDTNFVGNHTQDGDLTVNGETNLNTGPVNFNSVDVNYNSAPNLLGCEPAQPVNTVATVVLTDPGITQYVTVNIQNSEWTEMVTITSGSGVVTVTNPPSTFEYTVEWNASNEVVVTEVIGDGSGTVEVCRYNGVTQVTYDDNTIINDNGSITNNNGTEVYNVNVTEHYDETSEIIYNGTVINHYEVTENYFDTPEQISCEGSLNFNTGYVVPSETQFVEIDITFDNGVDGPDNQVVRSTVDSVTQTINFTSGSDAAVVEIVRGPAGTVTYSLVSGNINYFTINEICYYNGVSENNYTNKIHNYDGDIFNYNNITQTYNEDTTITNLGDTYLENLTVNNIDITGSVVGANRAHIEHTVATAGQTTITLNFTPASENFVWVSSRSSLYAKQDPLYDYTVAGNVVTLNTPANAGDVITVQYIESLGTNFPAISKGISPAMTGTTLVVTDPNVLPTSVIARTAQTSTAGFIEVVPSTGSFTINSSASESGVIFNYVITN